MCGKKEACRQRDQVRLSLKMTQSGLGAERAKKDKSGCIKKPSGESYRLAGRIVATQNFHDET